MALSLSFAFRAVGDFLVPTAIMGVTVLLNVALDPLLIFGWGPVPALGVAGAGLATFIAQLAGLGAYLWMIFGSRRNKLLVVRRPFSWNWGIVGQVFRIGIPSAVQNGLFFAGMLFMYRFLRPFGGEATAAAGVGFRIVQSAMLPGVAISIAVASLVGQNYGARKYSRVRATFGWGVLYVTLVFCAEYALILVNPRFWVSLFANEPGIIDLGAQYLLISGAMLPLYGASFIATFGSQGLGRTVAPLVAGFVRLCCGVLILLALDWWWGLNVPLIFWTGTLASIVEVLLMVGVLARLWRGVLGQPDAHPESAPQAVIAPKPVPVPE
jgi:putative MATE family efflux protein